MRDLAWRGPSVNSTTRATVSFESGGLREGRSLFFKRPSTPARMALLPAPDAGLGLARPPHDLRCPATGAGEKYDFGPPDMLSRTVAISGDGLKTSAIRRQTSKVIPVRMHRELAQFAPEGNPKADSYVR